MASYTQHRAEKSATEMAEEFKEWARSQPEVGTCLFCPDYRVEGTDAEVRAANAAHRASVHPEKKWNPRRRRRTTGGILTFGQYLTDEELAAVQSDRDKRLRLLGIVPE